MKRITSFVGAIALSSILAAVMAAETPDPALPAPKIDPTEGPGEIR